MSTSNANDNSCIARSQNPVQHSKDLALTEREYELLLEATRSMKDGQGQQAEQMTQYDDDLDVEEAIAYSWSAKTDAAERAIPFDFSPRCEIAVERFFDRYEAFPVSKTAINRRTDRAAEHAEELTPDDVTPHGLRATAASYHAGRGLSALPLQSMMGWAQLSTARVYIKQSPENTARALHQIHSQ